MLKSCIIIACNGYGELRDRNSQPFDNCFLMRLKQHKANDGQGITLYLVYVTFQDLPSMPFKFASVKM